MYKLMKTDQEGIKEILNVIDLLEAKCLDYFKNTFKYFLNDHPPLGHSHIFYDVNKNDFKFIFTRELEKLKYVKFDEYKPNDLYTAIRDFKFIYSTSSPFNVIISKAGFLHKYVKETNSLNKHLVIEEVSNMFFTWYMKTVQEEKIYWKNKLLTYMKDTSTNINLL